WRCSECWRKNVATDSLIHAVVTVIRSGRTVNGHLDGVEVGVCHSNRNIKCNDLAGLNSSRKWDAVIRNNAAQINISCGCSAWIAIVVKHDRESLWQRREGN